MEIAPIQPRIETFRASDGYRCHVRRWRPAGDAPAGHIVALHGIQSHSGWYGYSSRRMGEAGFDVWFLDRRGSGMNERDRGHALHADRLINDVVQALTEVRASAGEAPMILLGVSWGGRLALAAAAKRPDLIDGLALLYPGIRARVRPNILQRSLLRLAMATGKERRRVRIPLDDPALFTAEPYWQNYIRDDPLSLHQATVGFLSASVGLDAKLRRPPTGIDCPGLLMLAGGDRIIDNQRTLEFFDAVPLLAKQVHVYDKAAHTLEFEPDRERIFSDLVDWLRAIRAKNRGNVVR